MVLICISLMTNDAKYIYVPICHPYIFFDLVLIQTFLYTSIFIKWFISLLLSFESTLNILVTCPLLHIGFTNIFSSLWLVFSFSK